MESSFISFEQRISILDLMIILLIYILMINFIPEGGKLSYSESTNMNWYKSAEVLLLIATFVGMNINVKLLREWLGFSLGMIGLCKV